MQFINIVVHSVENMNLRVHLQYEFSHQGLDDYLEVRTDRGLCCISQSIDVLFKVQSHRGNGVGTLLDNNINTLIKQSDTDIRVD